MLGGRIFAGLPAEFTAGRYHSLYGVRMPAELEVTAESETDMRGLLGCGNGVEPGPATARLRVEIEAEGTDRQRLEELVEWADRHSPVGDGVRRAVPVELEVVTG